MPRRLARVVSAITEAAERWLGPRFIGLPFAPSDVV
jgi:hypothetical protein